MAHSTTLQMVTAKELLALRKTPSTISKLNKPGAESYSTYYVTTITFFLPAACSACSAPSAAGSLMV